MDPLSPSFANVYNCGFVHNKKLAPNVIECALFFSHSYSVKGNLLLSIFPTLLASRLIPDRVDVESDNIHVMPEILGW